MLMKLRLVTLVASAAIIAVVSPAYAVPGGAAKQLATESGAAAIQVRTRTCRYDSDGERYCRRLKSGARSYAARQRQREILDVGTLPPESFRTGSAEWWRAMDRAGRGGFSKF